MKPQDTEYMQQALSYAQKSRYITHPEPWVGCIIEKDDEILGCGASEKAGGEHAEVVAIHAAKQAGFSLKGATLYITFEPCCHRGRTPPCIDAIIRAEIHRVVIGRTDPATKGRGVERLRKSGCEVEVGVLEEAVSHELRSYIYYTQHQSSYTVLKVVQSIDGCILGEKSWRIGDEAKKDAHMLRNSSQAILISAHNVLHNNPNLTVDYAPLQGPAPLRVVLDRNDTLPLNAHIFQTEIAPTLCITSGNRNRNTALTNQGVDTISWNKPGSISIPFVQNELAKRGVLQLLVEGDAVSHFVEKQKFNELIVYVSPHLMGTSGKHISESWRVPSLPLMLNQVERLDDSVKMSFQMISAATAS